MSALQYFSIGEGYSPAPPKYPGYIPVTGVSRDKFPGCMLMETGWLTAPFDRTGDRLTRHKSDELYMFIGTDVDNPAPLNAEITIQIENDVLTLTNTCAVFIPAGAAHGRMTVKNVDRPPIIHMCHMNSDEYFEEFADATAPTGTYANNKVERYEPPSGKLPEAPPGFLELLLYLDSTRLAGAPYMETVWFKTVNDTGPAPHVHEFDEFIGFIGTDPSRPHELGATVEFLVEGERIAVTKPTLVYLPRGVTHSPILIPEMDRPIIHFSGGNGGDYARRSDVPDTNMFSLDN